MTTKASVVRLGASSQTNGVPHWQADQSDGKGGQQTSWGEIEVMQGLGITAMPYPADGEDFAEGIILECVGGRDAVCIGARDTRSAAIVGKMVPGDTVVHSTGPQQAAQLQLKEQKRQAVLATKDSRKRTMAVILDGKNDKFQIACLGAMIEIDKNGDISVSNASGAGFKIQGGKFYVIGELSLPGMTPGFCLMQGLPAGQPLSAPAVLLTPVQGVGK